MTQPQTNNLSATSKDWVPEQSSELYRIAEWSRGYFEVGKNGHLHVHPTGSPTTNLDLKELVDQLRLRDMQPPLLIRFTDILRNRLRSIADAFSTAITDHQYTGSYQAVYPIKVNQQRHVVEEVIAYSREHNFGLEAGSKPELLAILAMINDNDTPIICNGFKDAQFIEAIILASKIGRNIIPVVEKLSELPLIIKYAEAHNVRPHIGIRAKLAALGSGRWEDSGSTRSKFGLFTSEILQAVELLQSHNMMDCLTLIHAHLGSQLNNIQNIKRATNELARIYTQLYQLGANMTTLDVGGGLGVDYDGSKSSNASSMNYTDQEYANNIVFHVKEACDVTGVPHPTIISESGRAMVAYHSVLIMNVLGSSITNSPEIPVLNNIEQNELPTPIKTLYESSIDINPENYIEYFHDAQINRDEANALFNLGYCTLQQRGLAEKLFFDITSRAYAYLEDLDQIPDEFRGLQEMLADTYFINTSIFQSLPDNWAIGQLFPIMPIHRLDEKPTRHARLADITCDSDGQISSFIGSGEDKPYLELHPLREDEDYLVGVFLVGAYQEILGDMHNLFGDTNAVHIHLGDNDQPIIDHTIEGDTIADVLQYVQYDTRLLKAKFRQAVELALREKRITLNEASLLRRFYDQGLAGYTYLS
ncbi:biosynthetic arginine decarboxylase [Poriferisphaera sp. WC338]|uniref:biosynthetic arginine decarboxylase n=1 Tax=Poriferisphaera sp. WC338 TaxID=3425129 RepID=UPI003D816323